MGVPRLTPSPVQCASMQTPMPTTPLPLPPTLPRNCVLTLESCTLQPGLALTPSPLVCFSFPCPSLSALHPHRCSLTASARCAVCTQSELAWMLYFPWHGVQVHKVKWAMGVHSRSLFLSPALYPSPFSCNLHCRAFVNGFETINPETMDACFLDSGNMPYYGVYCIEDEFLLCYE